MGIREARAKDWQRLGREEFDVLVVGGGITGAGMARDAALRGLRVALVEQGDFGSGTSSRSSRLVHGGLRYLEMYEFRLVFESTHERARLMRLAPHLVRPLPFLYPIYEGEKPGMLMLRMGMLLYDALASFRNYRRHRRLRCEHVRTAEPALGADRLRGAFRYYDCITDDARLTLENVLGASEAGACCLNYVRFVAPVSAPGSEGRIAGGEVVDLVTGLRTHVRAAVVLNAGGPWADAVLGALGKAERPLLQPSKGVHVVVPWDRLPVHDAVVMKGVRDGRVVFCVPWGTATYVGTTDTPYPGAPEDVAADSDDVAYLLETANRFFPAVRLVPDDVLSTWAGIRPLVAEDQSSTYRVSREHVVESDARGVVTVAGGKLTTYRIMARQGVDAAIRLLQPRADTPSPRPCRTARLPLPGGVGLGRQDARTALVQRIRAAGFDERIANRLYETYGSRVDGLLARVAADPGLARPIVNGLPYVWAEVPHAAEEERVVHLDDFFVRRTHLFYKASHQGREVARDVARALADVLGWDEERQAEEVDRLVRLADATIACVSVGPVRPAAAGAS